MIEVRLFCHISNSRSIWWPFDPKLIQNSFNSTILFLQLAVSTFFHSITSGCGTPHSKLADQVFLVQDSNEVHEHIQIDARAHTPCNTTNIRWTGICPLHKPSDVWKLLLHGIGGHVRSQQWMKPTWRLAGQVFLQWLGDVSNFIEEFTLKILKCLKQSHWANHYCISFFRAMQMVTPPRPTRGGVRSPVQASEAQSSIWTNYAVTKAKPICTDLLFPSIHKASWPIRATQHGSILFCHCIMSLNLLCFVGERKQCKLISANTRNPC